MSLRPALLVFAAVALAILSVGAASAGAKAEARPSLQPTAHRHHDRGHHGPRVGGDVRRAWPSVGRAPRSRLARWLARQVGPAKRSSKGKPRPRSSAARLGASAGDPGGRPGATATISAAKKESEALQLARSYEIPRNDPSYERLHDWSWTYDSAVSAAAFAAVGERAESERLLDQLAALQHTDGSLEIAFDVETGRSAPIFRSGTLGWLGLAGASFDAAFDSKRYRETQRRAAEYLLSLQGPSGLIRGGPDVKWTSTLHNLIAYAFLVRLAEEEQRAGDIDSALRYQSAAAAIAAAIDSRLLVVDDKGARFRQGLEDDTAALDVQALGAMYLQGRREEKLAGQVLEYAERNFLVEGRSVSKSNDRSSYNMTYAAKGPFWGYRPYLGKGAPDVLWAEGTEEMSLATVALGRDADPIQKAVAEWNAITGPDKAPLQADRTEENEAFGVQYHVWPASSAAAWTLLARGAPAFFIAPLPEGESLVTDWVKVRGGNLFTVNSDGSIEMLGGAGERRALAGPASAADYTLTSNATLVRGVGYGLYLRATDTGGKITGYCLQFDHGAGTGEVVLRELQNDFELSAPLASWRAPLDFAWYGVPHVLSATVKGNSLTASLDGETVLDVPDLLAASATAVKLSHNVTAPIVPPATGSYGVRGWAEAKARFHQVTVGPAGG